MDKEIFAKIVNEFKRKWEKKERKKMNEGMKEKQ